MKAGCRAAGVHVERRPPGAGATSVRRVGTRRVRARRGRPRPWRPGLVPVRRHSGSDGRGREVEVRTQGRQAVLTSCSGPAARSALSGRSRAPPRPARRLAGLPSHHDARGRRLRTAAEPFVAPGASWSVWLPSWGRFCERCEPAAASQPYDTSRGDGSEVDAVVASDSSSASSRLHSAHVTVLRIVVQFHGVLPLSPQKGCKFMRSSAWITAQRST